MSLSVLLDQNKLMHEIDRICDKIETMIKKEETTDTEIEEACELLNTALTDYSSLVDRYRVEI